MKQSKISNAIQYFLNASGGTLTSPSRLVQYPCNEFIVKLLVWYDTNKLVFKIEQDGKQIFPVRTNLASGFFRPGILAANGFCEVGDLSIAVNPNAPLTIIYCNDDATQPSAYITIIMSSEDNQKELIEAVNKLIGKLTSSEVKK